MPDVPLLANAIATAIATPALLNNLTSFGAAGLIAWMWLTERRTNRDRDQQLEDAHDRILADRVQLDTTLTALRHNTEVLARLTAAFESQTIVRTGARREEAAT